VIKEKVLLQVSFFPAIGRGKRMTGQGDFLKRGEMKRPEIQITRSAEEGEKMGNLGSH